MLIKKHHPARTELLPVAKPSPLVLVPPPKYHDWPPYDKDNQESDTNSVCSFSSAPSFTDDEDEKMALDDTKYTSLRSAHDDIHPSPTSTSNPSPTLPEDTPIPRNEATNDHHPPDKATILTGELLQIGAMAVVGVVGFLLVFAVGAMVGDDRRTLDSGWEPRRGNGRRRGAYERRTLSGW